MSKDNKNKNLELSIQQIVKDHGNEAIMRLGERPKSNIKNWPKSFGKAMIGYAETLSKIRPDLAIITGDRVETLAFCICCAYMNIPIAHVQAGDKSGHIDDLSRAAISKFSNLHFAPSLQACKRLIKWGEDRKRIFLTGAPQLDDIYSQNKIKKSDYYIVIFHPILNEQKNIIQQLKSLITAINKTKIKVIWVYPNNDIGSKIILKELLKLKKNNKFRIFPSIRFEYYLTLLKNSKFIIGNSSSGIIEAPYYGVTTINIGNRQLGREQAKSIINCSR